MAIGETFVDALIYRAKQEAYEEAEMKARQYLDVSPTKYGETSSSVQVLRADTMLELRNRIRDRRWRKNGDNPGQMFAQSCELLKVLKDEYGCVAIVITSNHFDI